MSIGYNRAAKIVETLEEKGFVSPANHVGKRDVLVPEHDICAKNQKKLAYNFVVTIFVGLIFSYSLKLEV